MVLLNMEFYEADLKPVMVDWTLLWLARNGFDVKKSGAVAATFISGDRSEAEAVNALPDERDKKMLNLCHDWMTSYLPHVLQKIDRVSFGIMTKADLERAKVADPRMPLSRAKLSIPFIGKDVPSHASEFAHPDVTIGLTILAYRYEGLRYSDFTDILGNIQAAFSKEMGPREDRPSEMRFRDWVAEAGGHVCGSYRELDHSSQVVARGGW